MLKSIRDLHPDQCPPHPGEILRDDFLQRSNLGLATLAGYLDMPEHVLKEIIEEQCPVTRELASRFAERFGHSVRFWIGLQTQHDAWHGCQSSRDLLRNERPAGAT